MPMYVTLVNWTDQGIRDVKETVRRGEQAVQLAERMGGHMTLYWTQGRYDLVAVGEFPDDESASAVLLTIGSQGSVRSEVLRAHTAQDMQRILDKMP
ncbi:MAG TPA: GYD domain-containing protein [Thermomicrobiaceae bacterium]|nr:GYD domain-containing protein [Thermomicrobiaceae bacterium]